MYTLCLFFLLCLCRGVAYASPVSGQAVPPRATISLSKEKIASTGDFEGLVVLVDFPDRPFSVPAPASRFYALLNRSGYDAEGARGSVRDYFLANSDSLFRPSFRVVGPLRLSKPTAYYGENGPEGGDLRAGSLVIEACRLADSLVDFSQYDTNGNGRVDMVYFVYAGFGENENHLHPEYIWPHAGTIADSLLVLDHRTLGRYACSPEYMGEEAGAHYVSTIGLFCHELGHVLGLPDFYNTASGAGITPGSMSVMDAGNYLDRGRSPAAYSAFEREALGWLEVADADSLGVQVRLAGASAGIPPVTSPVTSPGTTAGTSPATSPVTTAGTSPPTSPGTTAGRLSAIPPGSSSAASLAMPVALAPLSGPIPSDGTLRAFKIRLPGTAETFYFENRQPQGWDRCLPAHGLLVFHVDRSDTTAWDENRVNTDFRHPRYQLIRSGGPYAADYTEVPFPGPDSVRMLSGSSDPALEWWTRAPIDFIVRHIRLDGTLIRLEYIPSAAAAGIGVP